MRALHLLAQAVIWSTALIVLIVVSDSISDRWAPLAVFAMASGASVLVARAFPKGRHVLRLPQGLVAYRQPVVAAWAGQAAPVSGQVTADESSLQGVDNEALQQAFLECLRLREAEPSEAQAILRPGARYVASSPATRTAILPM